MPLASADPAVDLTDGLGAWYEAATWVEGIRSADGSLRSSAEAVAKRSPMRCEDVNDSGVCLRVSSDGVGAACRCAPPRHRPRFTPLPLPDLGKPLANRACTFRRATFSSSRFAFSSLATSSSPIAWAIVTRPSYAAIS